jgi:hypothetical protein
MHSAAVNMFSVLFWLYHGDRLVDHIAECSNKILAKVTWLTGKSKDLTIKSEHPIYL